MIFSPEPAPIRKPRTFSLSSTFLDEFRGKQPNWGPVGYFTYKRTYARTLDDSSTEEFWQTLQRVVEGCFNIQKIHCRQSRKEWIDWKAQRSAQDMFRRMWEFKFTPPGRGLWMMGTDLIFEKGSAALQNCAFVSSEGIATDFAAPFCFLMDMSMLGVGVGGDTRGAGTVRIGAPRTTYNPYIVEDSREGWVDVVREVLNSFVGKGSFPCRIDFSLVRKRGAPIVGFGGIASGAAPLKKLIEGVVRLLLPSTMTVEVEAFGEADGLDCLEFTFEGEAESYPIKSTQIVDVFNYTGKCVVAGGVRRTAEIMFGDVDDEDFINLKSNVDLTPLYSQKAEVEALLARDLEAMVKDLTLSAYTALVHAIHPSATPEELESGWGSAEALRLFLEVIQDKVNCAIQAHPLVDRRWASNNSIFGTVGMDYSKIAKQIVENGEPGIFWLDNARKYSRMGDPIDNKDDRVMGTNPCGEQSLESFELCVSPDTYIQHRRGIQQIRRLVGEAVDIWNGDGWSTVTPRVTGEGRELFRVHLSDGSYLDCTSNHGWHVKPPGKRVFRRVETGSLVGGSQVVSFSIDAPIEGEYQSAAFEWGLFAGDGFLSTTTPDGPDGRSYTYPMVVVCGDKAKLMDLDVQGKWYKPQEVEGYTDPVKLNPVAWVAEDGDSHHLRARGLHLLVWPRQRDPSVYRWEVRRGGALVGPSMMHPHAEGLSLGVAKARAIDMARNIVDDAEFWEEAYLAHKSVDAKAGGRLSLHGLLPLNVAESLRSKTSGLAPDITCMSRDSILEFMAGWIEAEGSITNAGSGAEGFRLYGSEPKLRDAQILLRRVGINHATLRVFAEAGTETNFGTRNYDLYYLTIPSYECSEIPTRLKIIDSFGSRYVTNNAHPEGKQIDRARKQEIVKVEKLDGLHTTYCFDEPENHMGVFGNALTYQCNLVETYPAHAEDFEDFKKTLKMAYLYAKTVTLVPTHDHRANQVMQYNRRIGCSMSGIVQARQKLGHRQFFDWCDDGYAYINDLDTTYSRWLGIPKSKKMTSVKPSGTVSLLCGATPGIHFPHSEFYLRRVRVSQTSPLVDAARKAGYPVEDDIYADDTACVSFPVKEKHFVKGKKEVSIWEQFTLAAGMQRHWADNQVSVTVSFNKDEAKDLATCLSTFDDQLKAISLLPLSDHGYAQAPYEAIDEATYNSLVANITPMNLKGDAHDIDAEDKYCSGDSCTVDFSAPK